MFFRRKLVFSSLALLRFSHHEPRLLSSRAYSCSFFTQSRAPLVLPFPHSRFPSNCEISKPAACSNCRGFGASSSPQPLCWNCGAVAATSPFLSCKSCRSVQPVDHAVDYFQIFGIKRKYDLEVDANLEGKYKDWQKKLHPDLVHTKSEKEKHHAAEQSARVIDAYRTLSKPLSRALYLLQLEGVHVDEEKTLTDPDLLAEMMEMREAVEEASDAEALRQIQSQIQVKLGEWSNAFKEAFEKGDYDGAIDATQRMRYYEKAIEEIAKKS